MLLEAADAITFIREFLDLEDPSMKMRMLDGNAQALFNRYSTIKDEDIFVKDLVHETLKDAVGYVEGLNKERVDHYFLVVQRFRFEQMAKTAQQNRLRSGAKEEQKV